MVAVVLGLLCAATVKLVAQESEPSPVVVSAAHAGPTSPLPVKLTATKRGRETPPGWSEVHKPSAEKRCRFDFLDALGNFAVGLTGGLAATLMLALFTVGPGRKAWR